MKSVVLLSGGLDSTVNLYEAHSRGHEILALHFQYGQKAQQKEHQSVVKLTRYLGVQLVELQLPWFSQISGESALLDHEKRIPLGKSVQIASLDDSKKSAKSVWVPNRNGIFLNIAAGFAEARGYDFVIPGFNAEEASTFPDNSDEFLQILTTSFSFSTSNQVSAFCYTTAFQKSDLVRRAVDLEIPVQDMWPCYQSLEMWCGECESCQRFKRGLQVLETEHRRVISKHFLNFEEVF